LVDIRLFYTDRPVDSWTQCRWRVNSETPGFDFFRISSFTGKDICYTTEALKYAQSGYLASIVCMQWGGLLSCKTRNLSLAQQGMNNW
jgi:hypothetical protein